MIFFETERLVVRNWCDDDLETLFALYNDGHVMRFFPNFIPRDECLNRLRRWRMNGERDGFCFAPLALRAEPEAPMIGFAGLLEIVQPGLPRTGEHEIGWMLESARQRQGLASEAARGWLDHAFGTLGIGRVNAFTAAANVPSRAVMQSICMSRVANGDFDHPTVANGPLRRHVLYEIIRS